MSETETSPAASVDERPVNGARNATGHPMDAILQRIFNDPGVTLAGERQMIRAAAERYRAMASGRLPRSAAPQAEGVPDKADDAVAEGDLDAGDGEASDGDTRDGETDVVDGDADVGAGEPDAGRAADAEPDGAEARDPAAAESPAVRVRPADRLVALAGPAALFRTPEGEVYADLAIDGRRETWPVRSRGFRRWLTRRFFEAHRSAPSTVALHEAAGVIEAQAVAGAPGQGLPERALHLRVGGLAGKLYLDLGDETWRAVEIDAAGWRFVAAPPVRFRRPPSQRALPVPEAGGSIERLAGFLNLGTRENLVLVVAWALAALRDRGPCPILVLTGEQGSGKSTGTAMLQALIDPTALPPRGLPGKDRELLAAGRAAHVVAFDNLSAMPPWWADALCRRVGGAGAARPVIVNGIADLVTRPELAERALVITLAGIGEADRRPEAELWAAFEAERPRLLGVLLTAVAEGLRRAGTERPAGLPRLADFVLWAGACQASLWPAGTFLEVYRANRHGVVIDGVDADPLIDAVLGLAELEELWEGTASQLLVDIEPYFFGARGSREWPGNARVLGERLRQGMGQLRPLGIDVSFHRHPRSRRRLIRLELELPSRNPPKGVVLTRESAPDAPGIDWDVS